MRRGQDWLQVQLQGQIRQRCPVWFGTQESSTDTSTEKGNCDSFTLKYIATATSKAKSKEAAAARCVEVSHIEGQCYPDKPTQTEQIRKWHYLEGTTSDVEAGGEDVFVPDETFTINNGGAGNAINEIGIDRRVSHCESEHGQGCSSRKSTSL